MREEQARKEQRQERLMRFGVAGAILVAVVIIAVAIAATRGGSDDVSAVPASVSGEGGGVTDGAADAPVTVDVWMDFLCPHCKDFDALNGDTLNSLADSGDATVVYHPLTFTGGVYSSRANNAFACAVDEGKTQEFMGAAFDNSQQWSDSALVDLGESIGIGGDYASCVEDETYDGWSTAVAQTAQDQNVTATPTIFVNGTELPSSDWTPEGITAAVQAAAGGSATPGATPEATPAATPAATQ
jgi:protein-disulfide isomerase